MSITLHNITAEFDEGFVLQNVNWEIQPNQHWVILGGNGAGKSALAATLAGAGNIVTGHISQAPSSIGVISFEAQQQLIQQELKKDDADILDVISLGTSVRELIFNDCVDHDTATSLIEMFGFTYLLDRAFRKLSTGESRKVMITKALSCKPQLLILDEPFEGLDSQSLHAISEHLSNIACTLPMVFVLNRLTAIPHFITHVALMSEGQLLTTCDKNDQHAYNQIEQLLHINKTEVRIPAPEAKSLVHSLLHTDPLVRLNQVTIQFGDLRLIDQLDWIIEQKQHWQLSGPNGSGKTALLTLITGDHPQCYNNDIFVFGFKRGSGESIWQIKQFIGYVSTSLQWEYRVQISLKNVIISGFFDSIGLYSKASDQQKAIALDWLRVLGMEARADDSFQRASYGDQRLLLIARAMVKHPPLLILDEPCLGLDDVNRQLVIALIEKICASSDTTVIYVNHHPLDNIKGIDNFLSLTHQQ